MSEYLAPLKDMQFVLQEIAPLSELASSPDFAEVNLDLATAILEGGGQVRERRAVPAERGR